MSGTHRIQIAREWSVTLTDAVLMFHLPEYTGFRVERNFCEDVFLRISQSSIRDYLTVSAEDKFKFSILDSIIYRGF